MSRRLIWRTRPNARLFQVFTRRRRSVGVWSDEAIARAALARHRGGYLLVLDEYRATLPYFHHLKRVVVAEERRTR